MMAELDFSMDSEPKAGPGLIDKGEELVCNILKEVYNFYPAKLTLKQWATIQLYACERFGEHLGDTRDNYWTSVTKSVVDTLNKYPLGKA